MDDCPIAFKPITKKATDTVTIGIDQSTQSCGISIYKNGKYMDSFVKKFTGTFDLEKLKTICTFFESLFYFYEPQIVLLEEPLSVRNGRVTRHLNQLAGGILSVAFRFSPTVDMIHNRTIKSLMSAKTKEESKKTASSIIGKIISSDDESDSILIVESYKKIVSHAS